MVYFDEDKQEEKLKEIARKEQEDLARILAKKYGVSYVDLATVPVDTDALGLITEEKARAAQVAAFALRGRTIAVGAESPASSKVKALLENLKERGYSPELYILSPESLKKAWGRYQDISYAHKTESGLLDIASDQIEEFLLEQHTRGEVVELINKTLDETRGHRTTRLVEVILGSAMALGASDVHIEPEEGQVRLRMRFDGVLSELLDFDHKTYKLLLSRIKLLSGLILNITQDAQDGRFSIEIGEGESKREIEVRTSVLPGAYGESIVMRILNPDSIAVSMEGLGMQERLFQVMREEIMKPNGMILNTGPTGSGKTTTLYSFLRSIHKPGIKIITIENPIEYHIEGIVQTQVEPKKNYTFAQGLRASLRQDPDIIMVGEIRDNDTASTAVNAALTGHLVFSTLHTNNAAGTFPRLIDLGVNAGILGSSVNIAMAQRLMRKLRPDASEEVPLTDEQKKLIEKTFETYPHKGEVADLLSREVVKRAREDMGDEAYQGRIGVFEVVRVTPEIEAVLKTTPTETDITEAARAQGLPNMQQDALLKILSGTTDFAEFDRVVGS